MDRSSLMFLVHITDGYSFGKMIGIVKSETEHVTMVFSPETIEISFINGSKCAVHKIVLYTQELAQYSYNIRGDDGELLPEYPIAVDANELFNTTKGIGRRDAIRLYWLAGDNKINIQPIKNSTKDPGRGGALFVKILSMEHTRYDIPTYNKEPNVRVSAKDFADICGQASTLKCAALEMVGQANGVIFNGILPNNTIASTQKFMSQTAVNNPSNQVATPSVNIPNMEEMLSGLKLDNLASLQPTGLTLNIIKKEDALTVRVAIATVKALSKIHNISQTGTLLRFFFAEGLPTKIESPISTYGLYTCCLRNVKA